MTDKRDPMSEMMAGADLAELRAENSRLRQEVAALQAELDDLRFESDLDACHAAGLAAQLKAIIAEGDACPNKGAHPMLARETIVSDRTGEELVKTKSYPLYRQAFDAEAAECGIPDPEQYRS